MSAGKGFLQHLGSVRADDEDDNASSHLLAELQRGERGGGDAEQQALRHTSPGLGADPAAGAMGLSREDDDEPPQSIMYEPDDAAAAERDAESSHTPQAFPGSMTRDAVDPFAENERGRQAMASAMTSTIRSNSASPPPDLLESASSPEMRRKGLGADRLPAINLVPGSCTSSASAAYQSFPPSGARSEHGARSLSAAEKGKGRAVPRDARRSNRHKHINSQRDMVNGDSLSDTSSSADSQAELAGNIADSPDSGGPSRSASRTSSRHSGRHSRKSAWHGLDERQKALWSWVNVVDLDGYLQEVRRAVIGVAPAGLTQ